MLGRLLLALFIAAPATIALTSTSEASKGPDATEVGAGMFLVVLGLMAFLAIVYAIKVALGGARVPPPDEGLPGGHH